MSDDMESGKDQMTAKERIMEQMRRQLIELKMYESWYSYEDMKQILGVIKESKDMAKNAQKDRPQSSNSTVTEAMLKANLLPELEIIRIPTDKSRSLNLNRPRHSSPIPDHISVHSCESPEAVPTTAHARSSAYNNRILDSDTDSHSTDMETHPECDEDSGQWEINPLDTSSEDSDMALEQPDRSLVEDPMPFNRLCKKAKASEMSEKLTHVVNMHLKDSVENWYKWYRTTGRFQWGTPIQVERAKGSQAKKSKLTGGKADMIEMECTIIFDKKRPIKRKSAMALPCTGTRDSSSDKYENVPKKNKTRGTSGEIVIVDLTDDEPTTSNAQISNPKSDTIVRPSTSDSPLPRRDVLHRLQNRSSHFRTKQIHRQKKKTDRGINVTKLTMLIHARSQKRTLDKLARDRRSLCRELNKNSQLIEKAGGHLSKLGEGSSGSVTTKKGGSKKIPCPLCTQPVSRKTVIDHISECAEITSDDENVNNTNLNETTPRDGENKEARAPTKKGRYNPARYFYR